MKNLLTIALTSLFIATLTVTAVLEVNSCAEQQAVQFATAVDLYKRECLKRMHEAEDQRNMQKVIYYRYQFNNADKAILSYGADLYLKNRKAR